MIPDASNTPSAPKSIAAFISSPVVIPAPHNTLMSLFIAFTSFTVSSTTSGCAWDTGIPVPMSSGGSTATAVGASVATAF